MGDEPNTETITETGIIRNLAAKPSEIVVESEDEGDINLYEITVAVSISIPDNPGSIAAIDVTKDVCIEIKSPCLDAVMDPLVFTYTDADASPTTITRLDVP